MSLAEVRLWGTRIGAVLLEPGDEVAGFEYDPAFVSSGFEPAPFQMPLAGGIYRFPGLARESFFGLPGMLADSLPDRYGHALIDAWLATRGRSPDSFDPVERLCYVGRRGMGALEFEPATGPRPGVSHEIDVAELTALAGEVLSNRGRLSVSLKSSKKRQALREILRVGTSAGGARAKALIALNPETREVRSGQLEAEPGFEHWILKFDGVDDQSRELGEPAGYGAIELAYAAMARAAGIEISECRLLEEGGRRHFMTRRFDREGGSKLHMQSLAALAHLDFNLAGAYGYELALQTIRRLGLPMATVEEQYRRMVFNVIARNQDDHVKNIAFLMDRTGAWRLSPAFDVIYAHNPQGRFTARHQMSVNGKTDSFTAADLDAVADTASIQRNRARQIVAEVAAAVTDWPRFAAQAGVGEQRIAEIAAAHRLELA